MLRKCVSGIGKVVIEYILTFHIEFDINIKNNGKSRFTIKTLKIQRISEIVR